MPKHLKRRARNNLILFSLSIIYIFVLGLIESFFDLNYAYHTVLSAIFLFSIFTISGKRNVLISVPSIIVILTWVTEIMDMEILSMLTGYISVFFFLFVIVRLVIRVADSPAWPGTDNQ